MIIKYPGAKHYHKNTIVKMMRATDIYCEPFFGSGKVFFWKMYNTPSAKNLLSDLDAEVINFWKVLKEYPLEIQRGLAAIPYCREAFEAWRDNAQPDGKYLIEAMRYFVLRGMSRSGLMKDFSDSTRQRRGMDEGESAWKSRVEAIPVAAQMLQWASLDICPAIAMLDLVKKRKDCLTYADPPYYTETRVTQQMYKHEMAHEDHVEFLESAVKVEGKMIISGYDCQLYRTFLSGKSATGSDWVLTKINTVNRMSQGKELAPRVECLWRNYW